MTSGFAFYGYRAMPYELRHDRLLHNFLGRKGFVLASTVTYRLAPIFIVMMAPVCSTWVFLSRSKTLRSHAYPLGFHGHPHPRHTWLLGLDSGEVSHSPPLRSQPHAATLTCMCDLMARTLLYQRVREANTMVARCVMLCLLLSARGVCWVLEQPQNSMLQYHPRFQQLLSSVTVYAITFNMQRLGAATVKPTTSDIAIVLCCQMRCHAYLCLFARQVIFKLFMDREHQRSFLFAAATNSSANFREAIPLVLLIFNV
jgi:hypothetical protein